jgi:streptomycin 6-kinase
MYALVEAWNGTSWSIQSTPRPKAGAASQLFGVSCTSATECAAVGSYANSDGTSVTLVETWNGTSWSIKPSPNPTDTVGSTLFAISCSATTACAAVGYYYNVAGVILTFAEEWNGTRWSVRPSPNPSGTAESVLYDVSCWSATACIAVGSSGHSTGPYVTLAEAYSG